MIEYREEKNLTTEEFINVLKNSTLGERRPIDDLQRISSMLRYANLIITARHEGKLVGVARSLTDFAFCTYLSDLAVDEAYQRRGIGRELIKFTKSLTPQARLILLAAPRAVDYYPHIGMIRHEYCFYIDRTEEIT
jgi:GNAT superfamily N-acetyltransferase